MSVEGVSGVISTTTQSLTPAVVQGSRGWRPATSLIGRQEMGASTGLGDLCMTASKSRRTPPLLQALADRVDRQRADQGLAQFGGALVCARLLEQAVRTLASGLTASGPIDPPDLKPLLDDGTWATAEHRLLDHWPDQLPLPDGLADRLRAARSFRNDRLAHGLCDQLLLLPFGLTDGINQDLLDELAGYQTSCVALIEELCTTVGGWLAARHGSDIADAQVLGELFAFAQVLLPEDFAGVSLHDTHAWTARLAEVAPRLGPLITDALNNQPPRT